MLRRFAALNVFFYRVSGGRLMHRRNELPVLLLTTIGRSSGNIHTTPVVYLTAGEQSIVMPGVYEHPDWYLNLKVNPQASIQIGSKRYEVLATQAEGEERDRLWAMAPSYWHDYQAQYADPLPMMILQRRS